MKYLKENYAANPGFPEVNLYLYDRYFVLSDQFRNTRRYVSIDPDNRYTFSDEFSTIILSAGAVFSSAMNALLKVADSVPKGWPEMKDYSKSCWMRFQTSRAIRFASSRISVQDSCCPITV